MTGRIIVCVEGGKAAKIEDDVINDPDDDEKTIMIMILMIRKQSIKRKL